VNVAAGDAASGMMLHDGGPVISQIPTRTNLHRIAAHVVARRRHEVTGRFGLRPTPGGFGTPAFGESFEVVRVSGLSLVHEAGADVRMMPMTGSTLRILASFVGADIDAGFSVGSDTPDIGDPDEPLDFEADSADAVAGWFGLGSVVLDTYVGVLGVRAEAATTQLWPEHFDLATSVTLGNGRRANAGFSAGDGFEPEPYAYFGPWGEERPGDPSFWNAPFGAVLPRKEVCAAEDPKQRLATFFREGSRLLGDG